MSETTDQQQAKPGKFKPGQSGNPAGRPKGARHKTTLAVEALLDGEAEMLTRKAIELAMAGDLSALRLCLERIAPPRKERFVEVPLPLIANIQDTAAAAASVLEAVANGFITPSEGQALSSMIEQFRKSLESADIERRLLQLEERML